MMATDRATLEICVDGPQGLRACAGLADRIELCAGLDLGGLTPGPGLMQAAAASGLTTHVLIRPRAGDFDYSEDEITTCIEDIRAVRALGLAGVVIGATRDGALDRAALTRMIRAAGDLCVTLHRAIDVVADPAAALETAIDLGFRRMLTSGGARTALAGAAGIRQLRARAQGRIEIMAGSGITADSAAAVLDQTGVRALHASCSVQTPLQGAVPDLGFGLGRRRTDRAEIMRLLAAMGRDPDQPAESGFA